MNVRTWGVGFVFLLVGAAAAFGFDRSFHPSDNLTVPNGYSSDVQGTLGYRGISGDVDGSSQVRSEIVERCARSPDMLACMRGNYHLLLIDAENGSRDGMIATAMALTGSPHCTDLNRAQYWLYKARSLGKDVREAAALISPKLREYRCR
jgi:hypothetical protein